MILYRDAQAGDAAAIAGLHARSWRESYRGAFTDEFLDGDLLGERLAVWRARLDPPPRNQLVVMAVEGASLEGFVCAVGAEDPHWGSLIDNLHVAAPAKRRGIGSELMRRAGTWLDRHHPESSVYLWVLEANSAARRFYEQLGARNAGTVVMETHGGAIVRSCRYVWPEPGLLASA